MSEAPYQRRAYIRSLSAPVDRTTIRLYPEQREHLNFLMQKDRCTMQESIHKLIDASMRRWGNVKDAK